MSVPRRRAAPAPAQLPRSRAREAPSPPALLPPPPRPAVSAAGRGVSGACGLGPRAPGRGEEASAPRQLSQAQRGARGGRTALSSICCGGWPPPPPAGSGYVRCPVVVAGAGRRLGTPGLGDPVGGWARFPARRRKPELTTWGLHSPLEKSSPCTSK